MKKLRTLFFIMCMAYFAGCIFASCEAPEIGSEVEDGAHDNTDGTDGAEDTEDTEGSGDENETDKPDTPEDTGKKEFVMLFTNDFHSQIEPLSKDEKYNADRGGAKRLKALVDSVRAAEPAVLLADAGDLVQGTYYFSLLNGIVEMMMMEEMGYDVRTLGNHEFDKKMTGLGYMLSLNDVPVVASNYDFSKTDLAGRVCNSIIIKSGNVKVGFIGLNVRLHNLVTPSACKGVEWQNAINVADSEAKKLLDKGADMVIALSHLGYENNDVVYYDRGIAMNTRHIDMIIGGHSHTFLNKADYVTNLDGDKVPIVQTGSKGICLGYAKITLDDKGKPSFTYRLIPVDNRLDSKVDKEFSAAIDVYSAALSVRMNEVIGYCPKTLRNGKPESPLGNITGDGLVWMAKEYFNIDADLGLYNSGGIRAEISAGNVTVGDIYAVYPFDNVLYIVTLKGRDLLTLCEYVAGSNGLPISRNIRMVLDDNYEIKSVTINGEEIDEDKTYKVATVDYLVELGRYGLENAIDREYGSEIIRDYFVEYFRYLASHNDGKIPEPSYGRIIFE